MGIIEEIPDEPAPVGPVPPPPAPDSLESMIQAASEAHFAKTPLSAPAGPEMPGAMAEVKQTSIDEFIRQMNKMPLFMTELDETGADDKSENTALEAIKALQEEGEPWEVRKPRTRRRGRGAEDGELTLGTGGTQLQDLGQRAVQAKDVPGRAGVLHESVGGEM
jgi:hypothetical protein